MHGSYYDEKGCKAMPEVSHRWEAILNQSKYHHEHEKFYAKAPLK
jgi:hypothetical protein